MRRSNLHLIDFAIKQYENVHGHFPPVIERDKSGQLSHSWRAMIAQNMSVEKIPYDFQFSWNSPQNRSAIDAMPIELSSPVGAKRKGCTNYIAVTGFGTIWQDGRELTEGEFLSLPSNAIIVVEVPDSDTVWTEPRDMSFDEFLSWWSKDRLKYLKDPPFILLRDGSVEPLSDGLVADLKQLHDQMTKSTGQ